MGGPDRALAGGTRRDLWGQAGPARELRRPLQETYPVPMMTESAND